MIIQSVEIEKFRGFLNKRVFKFDEKKFILLSASNGKGKTSVVDAIEWCFTGDIKRLHNAYDLRSTNNVERKKNIDGLLKNKNSDDGEVKVRVCVLSDDGEYIIERTQKIDALNPEDSVVTVNDGKIDAVDFLSKFVNKNFYKHYFCDVQKAFGLLSKKREDLPELFEDFIADYSREETVARNLKVFVTDIERKMEHLEQRKTGEDTLLQMQDELKKYESMRTVQPYNPEPIYQGEKLTLTEMSKEEMTRQIDDLHKCGYSEVYNKLKKYVKIKQNKETICRLETLLELRREYGKKIDKVMELDIYGENKEVLNLMEELEYLNKTKITTNDVCLQEEKVKRLNNPKLSIEKYSDDVKKISIVQNEINRYNDEISVLSKGNEILNTLTSLLANKEAVIAYRTEQQQSGKIAKCPICGSLDFDVLRREEILVDAEKYKGEHAELIINMKQKVALFQKDLDSLYKELLSLVDTILIERKEEITERLKAYDRLKDETKLFFEEALALEKISPNDFKLNKICSEDIIEEEINNRKKKINSEEKLQLIKKDCDEILHILNFQCADLESDESVLKQIEPLAFGGPQIIEFTTKMLTEKLNSLRGAIANDEYSMTQKKLREAQKLNESLGREIIKLMEIKRVAECRSEEIMNTITLLRKSEYESVGPFLLKYFKKFARMDVIKEIRVVGEENKISLHDEKNKNVLNVLSNGQLSVFMLSYFLGSAISRSASDGFRTFFIDDLTACMDDINMLAFIDFMKYQLSQKGGFMDQIFFVTCDDRIRKLIQYKLDGCKIEFTELGEADFS